MKTLITTLTLILIVSIGVKAQAKPERWIENGCGFYYIGIAIPDTINKCFRLEGKDSLTYTVNTSNCNCDFYISSYDHKKHSCKGLKRHYIETHFLYWCKNIVFVKGVKISEDKPHWDSNTSEYSSIEGEYEQNNKIAYVHSIHLFRHKLINNKQPYKFTSEWVTLNNY